MNRFRVLASLVCLCAAVWLSPVCSASDPVGKWRGEWQSQSTGHRGPMRANVWKANDGTYQARFSGRFALVIPFTYKVTMHPSYDPHGNVHLHVAKPLGPLMGSYTMDAVSSGNDLNGSFRAAKDVGSVRMRRVR